MPCDRSTKSIRQIYIGGCFKFTPYLLLIELNFSEEWEAWISLKEKIALVIINHGQKQIGVRDDGSPIVIWCKKTLFAVWDNNEEEKTEWIEKSYKNSDPLPKNWDDWRQDPYRWEVPQPDIRKGEESDNQCVNKYQYNKYVNLLENKLISVKSEEIIECLHLSDNLDAKLYVNKLSKDECDLNETVNIPAKLIGFNLSPKQLESAKIIGASGWAKIYE